jgi:hypothetical protein
MRDLHIHFFGCSFTAGDELTDEKYFPWKFTEEHTVRSFFKKRLTVNIDYDLYQFENKQLAYPKLIMDLDSNIKTTCYSLNGKSMRHNIFDIIRLVEEGNTQIDCIYLQISPTDRELIFNECRQCDIQLHNPVDLSEAYITEKLKIAMTENQTLHDAMDMYMLDGYLKSKGIPFYFLNISEHLAFRKKGIYNSRNEATDNFNFLSLDKFTNVLDIQPMLRCEDRLLGSHLSKEQHQLVAEQVLNHIKGQFE